MSNGEVVVCKIRARRVGRDERRIGIAEDLADVVVLHHDHENVVKMANALCMLILLGQQPPRERRKSAENYKNFSHGDLLSLV